MAQLMPLPLTVSCFSEIQIGFNFLVWLTWVVPEKGPLNGCAYSAQLASAALDYVMFVSKNSSVVKEKETTSGGSLSSKVEIKKSKIIAIITITML